MKMRRHGMVALSLMVALGACTSGSSGPSAVSSVADTSRPATATVAPSEPDCSLDVMIEAAGSKWPKKSYGEAASASQAYCADGWAAVPYVSPKTGDPIAEVFRLDGGTWVYVDSYYGTCDSLVDAGVPKDVAHKILPDVFCTFG